MKLLVVGGNRFVGRDLVFRFLAAGHEVTLLNRGNLDDPFGGSVQRLCADRSGPGFARVLRGHDWDAAVDFAVFEGAHARSAVEVLEGRVGHYVMISTGQVYLVREPRPAPAAGEADYDGPLMPEPVDLADRAEWAYGMGKRRAEDALGDAWARQRFPSTRLRLPMVNGERDYHRRLEGYVYRLFDGQPLLLPDGGRTPTRHVYSGAVARAIARLIGNPATFGRAYNLAQDETPTLIEILSWLAELIGAPARFVDVPRRRLVEAGLSPVEVSPFSGAWMSFLDPALAKAELGFRHEPVRQYLDKIVAAFMAHPPAQPPEAYLKNRAAERAFARL
jgi:nucleoside-diphosphate-sugar epimerase